MTGLSPLGQLVRLAFFLTVLGVLVVVVVGPLLLAVLLLLALLVGGILLALPFALVGLAAWGLYQAVAQNPAAAWRAVREGAVALVRWAGNVLRDCGGLTAWGWRRGRAVLAAVTPVARSAGAAASGLTARAAAGTRVLVPQLVGVTAPVLRFAGRLFAETAAGAGVGALLLYVLEVGHPDVGPRVAFGAVAGAFVGLSVAVLRSRPQEAPGRVG